MSENLSGHYTSQGGLIGIVSSEVVWATNIKFLNDEHEFQDALDLIREIIPTSKIKPEYRDHAVHTKFIEKLERELKLLDNYVAESIFTFSFSDETDLLSQWRGYCPDNNGFCLVFDVDKFYSRVKEIYDEAHFVRCIYKKEEKENKLRELLNKYWLKYVTADSDKARKAVMDSLGWEVMLLASHFKHPSFSEEKERRIVVIAENGLDSELKFREGRFSIIPYIELPAPRKNIKKVYIGPTMNKSLSKRALEMFLEKTFGLPPSLFKGFEVVHSMTPYRPW